MSLSQLVTKLSSGKTYSIGETVISKWEAWLSQDNRREQKSRVGIPGRYHPHSADACERAIVYEQTNQPHTDPPSPRLLRIFHNGSGFHTRVQGEMLKAGVLEAVEVPVEDKERGITGTADGLGNVNGVPFVIEFKSINDRNFQMLVAPQEEHVVQTNLYMHMAKRKKGLIVYEGKSSQEIKYYDIDADPTLLKRVFEKFARINTLYLKKKLPERPYKSPSVFPCRYCFYKSGCWSDRIRVQFTDVKQVGLRIDVVSGAKKRWQNGAKRKA